MLGSSSGNALCTCSEAHEFFSVFLVHSGLGTETPRQGEALRASWHRRRPGRMSALVRLAPTVGTELPWHAAWSWVRCPGRCEGGKIGKVGTGALLLYVSS